MTDENVEDTTTLVSSVKRAGMANNGLMTMDNCVIINGNITNTKTGKMSGSGNIFLQR